MSQGKVSQGKLSETHFQALCSKELAQKELPGVGGEEVLPPFCLLHHFPLNDCYLLPECRGSGKLHILPFTSHRLSIKPRDPSVLPWSLLAMCHVRESVLLDPWELGHREETFPVDQGNVGKEET